MAAKGTKVTILSQKHRIEGLICLIPGARLTDYMNHSNRFIAVTDARVFDQNDNQIIESSTRAAAAAMPARDSSLRSSTELPSALIDSRF